MQIGIWELRGQNPYWLILSKAFPCLFGCFPWFSQGFKGLSREGKSLVNSGLFLDKNGTIKERKDRARWLVPGTFPGSSQGQPDQKVFVYVPFSLKALNSLIRGYRPLWPYFPSDYKRRSTYLSSASFSPVSPSAPNCRSFKGQRDQAQEDREPLRGKSASERVSEGASEKPLKNSENF